MKKLIIMYSMIIGLNINAQNSYNQFKEREIEVNKNIKEEVVRIKKNYFMIKPLDAVAGNIGVYVAKDGLVLVDELENHFDVKFTISEITDVKTVADIKRHLKNHNVKLDD